MSIVPCQKLRIEIGNRTLDIWECLVIEVYANWP